MNVIPITIRAVFLAGALMWALPAPATDYYVAPLATSGSGTLADPWGMPDLFDASTSPTKPRVALTTLQPGDTLNFRGGDYVIAIPWVSGAYVYQVLSPTRSGTTAQPITLRSYPGETAHIVCRSGHEAVFGTSLPLLDHIRFLGFRITVTASHDSGKGTNQPAAFHINGTGNEIGYCEIVGASMTTLDNHEGIGLTYSVQAVPTGTWIHHNDLHGWIGNWGNSCAIKLYGGIGTVIEDNWIHGNTTGVVDKDGGPSSAGIHTSAYHRNWITGNHLTTDPAANTGGGFMGTVQNNTATFELSDNVIDQSFSLGSSNSGSSYNTNQDSRIRNNLFRIDVNINAGYYCMGGSIPILRLQSWNNIFTMPADGVYLRAFACHAADHPQGLATDPFTYFDCNFYNRSALQYEFADLGWNLAQARGAGFESHSGIVTSLTDIYQDTTSWTLRPAYTTAGRYGDQIGPRYPIAQILDPTRYGPQAPGSGTGGPSSGAGGSSSDGNRCGFGAGWAALLLALRACRIPRRSRGRFGRRTLV